MRCYVFLFLTVLSAMLCGCVSQDGGSGSDQIKAVTTIAPLGEFVKAVGGDRVEVMVLIPPGSEPHTFEPSPSQMRNIADANIYVENGAGLESWIGKIIQVNQRMLLLDSSEGLELIKGADDNSQNPGSIQGVDPHIWLSPRNAKTQVKNICDGLIQVDPSNSENYISNRDNYLKELDEVDAYLNSTFAQHQMKKFIVLHPAWSYFARDYGLQEIAINLEEKEPGPKHLENIIDLARAQNITTIFVEPQFNSIMAEVIAKEIKGKVVAIDPLAENYSDNLRHVGDLIADSLGD
jgi:zinc transport system substrate-binding protein